ncbi:hypothetical protein AGMMS49992_18590 [Clostridia bacterium]|nr:hypothetical protein AGMMS49992_18590 [Clostridia bacterium]
MRSKLRKPLSILLALACLLTMGTGITAYARQDVGFTDSPWDQSWVDVYSAPVTTVQVDGSASSAPVLPTGEAPTDPPPPSDQLLVLPGDPGLLVELPATDGAPNKPGVKKVSQNPDGTFSIRVQGVADGLVVTGFGPNETPVRIYPLNGETLTDRKIDIKISGLKATAYPYTVTVKLFNKVIDETGATKDVMSAGTKLTIEELAQDFVDQEEAAKEAAALAQAAAEAAALAAAEEAAKSQLFENLTVEEDKLPELTLNSGNVESAVIFESAFIIEEGTPDETAGFTPPMTLRGAMPMVDVTNPEISNYALIGPDFTQPTVDDTDALPSDTAPLAPTVTIVSNDYNGTFVLRIVGQANGFEAIGYDANGKAANIGSVTNAPGNPGVNTEHGFDTNNFYNVKVRLFNCDFELGGGAINVMYGPWVNVNVEPATQPESTGDDTSDANEPDETTDPVVEITPLSEVTTGTFAAEVISNTAAGGAVIAITQGWAYQVTLYRYATESSTTPTDYWNISSPTNTADTDMGGKTFTIPTAKLDGYFRIEYRRVGVTNPIAYPAARFLINSVPATPTVARPEPTIYKDTLKATWPAVKNASYYIVSIYAIDKNDPLGQSVLVKPAYTVTSEFIDIPTEAGLTISAIRNQYRAIWINVQAVNDNDTPAVVADDIYSEASKSNTIFLTDHDVSDAVPTKPLVNWLFHYEDGTIRVEIIAEGHTIEIWEKNGGTSTKILAKDLGSEATPNRFYEVGERQPTAYPYSLTIRVGNYASDGAISWNETEFPIINANTHPEGPQVMQGLDYTGNTRYVYLRSSTGIEYVDYTGTLEHASGIKENLELLKQLPNDQIDITTLLNSKVTLPGDVLTVYAQSWVRINGTLVQSKKSASLVIKYEDIAKTPTTATITGTFYEETLDSMTVRVEITGPIDPKDKIEVWMPNASGVTDGSIKHEVLGSELQSKKWFEFKVSPINPGDYKVIYNGGTTPLASLYVSMTPIAAEFFQPKYPLTIKDGYLIWSLDGISGNNQNSYYFMVYEVTNVNGNINKITSTTGTRIAIPSSAAVNSMPYVAYYIRTVLKDHNAYGSLTPGLRYVSKSCPAIIYRGLDVPDYGTSGGLGWDDPWADTVTPDGSGLWWDGFYFRDSNGNYYDSNGNFISSTNPSGTGSIGDSGYGSSGGMGAGDGSGNSNGYYDPETGIFYPYPTDPEYPYYPDLDEGEGWDYVTQPPTGYGLGGSSGSGGANIVSDTIIATEYSASVDGAMRLSQEFVFEAGGIDPSITNNSVVQPLMTRLFEGLVVTDAQTNEQVGANAESWKINEDGTVYTFTLNQDLKWSDGSPLTANDYVYTYQRILTDANQARNSALLTMYIDNAQEFLEGTAKADDLGVKALDDYTLELTINEKSDYFLTLLTAFTYSPVQEKTIEEYGSRWTMVANALVGNGPYKVASLTPSQLILEPNLYYNGPSPAAQEQVVFDLQ